MRWLAVVVAVLAVVPATAHAKGTWTSSDFKVLTVKWQADDGQPVSYVDFRLTQDVESAKTSFGENCSQGQTPREVICPAAAQGGRAAEGEVEVRTKAPVGCKDEFPHRTQAGANPPVDQQPIKSANNCDPPPPPPNNPQPPPGNPPPPPKNDEPAGGPVATPLAPLVVGADAGAGPHVKASGFPSLAVVASFFASDPSFGGGVRVATGDVNGDGVMDVITGAGPGAGPHVKVFNGTTGALLASFFAYAPAFSGGVFVAAGDVNGDGRADIVTGPAGGAPAHVKVFNGATLGELRSFFAYPTGFTGGVRVAAGDVDGDGRADLVTGTGPGGGPHVKVFDDTTGAETTSFFAYAPAFSGGVFVAAGDVNGDGRADVITGAGPGAGPHVKAFSGMDTSTLASFFAYETSFNGGVRVGAADVNGDGRADIATGAGPGGPSGHIRIFNAPTAAPLASFFAFPGFNGGVFVGGASHPGVVVPTGGSTLPVTSDGTTAIDASCPPGGLLCRGRVELRSPSRTRRRRGAPKPPPARAAQNAALGRGTFSLRPGQKAKVKVRLSPAARRSLARRRRLPVIAVVLTRDRAGNTSTKTVPVVLRPMRT